MSRLRSDHPGGRQNLRRPCRLAGLAYLLVIGWLSADAHGQDRVASTDARASAMSARIDEFVNRRLQEAGVKPAPTSDDAEFLRRVSLDLTGVVPTASEALEFLGDQRPDKRARLIDRLLAGPRYATHMANTWSKMLLPADALSERFDQVAVFNRWLRRRFAENSRYDNLVADLLTATGSDDDAGATLFYTAAELKPEELAASTSRIFLGVQIQCAQCHNHPFDHWKQEDFWSLAAFFARIEQSRGMRPAEVQLVDLRSGEVLLPDTDQVVPPKYLGAEPPPEDADVNRRRQLAIWTVSRDNPYFAKVAANRVWAQLFGRGLVEPVDDFSPQNPPSHPELLDELAAWFVESGYDLKALLGALAGSEAYQRTSRTSSASEPELFARMQLKVLTPEQLYDCLARIMRRSEGYDAPGPGAAQPAELNRQQFIARFNMVSSKPTEFQAGIPQVLALMNGPLIAAATNPAESGLLLALEAPFFSDQERVESLFLAALARPPDDDEREQFVGYVAGGGPAGDRCQALGDVLWALLNSPEFILNH